MSTSVLAPYTEHRIWGRLELPDPIRTSRSGLARYRLRVYAPGTNDSERHELAKARRWWLVTAIATLIGESLVASMHSGPVPAGLVALAAFAVSWYWLARTRTIRKNTRTLAVAVLMIGEPHRVIGNASLFEECCRRLERVDDGTSSSSGSPVEREAIWAGVYDLLDPQRA